MSSTPPVVPSRNALRALRRLAYGGSAVIGAVGSVFTVAGVSYDTRRRLRFAERLIETKRTIKTVSNSNGAAHVARMFEAAEKGEDFGLGITRSRKRNRKRDFSAFTAENAQRRSPTNVGPLRSCHLLSKDQKGGGYLANKVSLFSEESVKPLQGSPRNWGRLVSSPPRWTKGLSSTLRVGQGQLGPERYQTTAINNDTIEQSGHAQAETRLPSTGTSGARNMFVEAYPTMWDILDTTFPSRSRLNIRPPRMPDLSKKPDVIQEQKGVVQRILVSTQQQHKVHEHGAYGRPSKDHVTKRARVDPSTHKTNGAKTNSSAAEKIIAATQQQHKLHSQAVYGRPGKSNTGVHHRLNEHVALWLNGAPVSRNGSGLGDDHGSKADLLFGGDSNSKRLSSTFAEGTFYLKPLERNFSTSACEAHALPRKLVMGTASVQQQNSQVAVAPANSLHLVTHTFGMDSHEILEELPSSFQPTNHNKSTFCALEKHRRLRSNERHVPSRSELLSRRRGVVQRFRNYAQYSYSSSKDQDTAPPKKGELQPAEQVVLSSNQSTSSITSDLPFKPRPVSALAGADPLQDSIMDSPPFKKSQTEVMEMQQSETNVVNDISVQSSSYYDRKSGIKMNLSRRKSEAFFGFDEAFDKTLRAAKKDGSPVWQDAIQAAIQTHGAPAARQFWLNAMAHYASPGNMLDWGMVDALHKHFHKKFWAPQSPYLDFYPARLLTRHILETDPAAPRAAELLFPLQSREIELAANHSAKGLTHSAKQRSRDLFANASKYLQDLWEEGYGAEKVISELRKIIQVTKLQDIKLAEDLFFGTIRRLSSNGQMEQAQALFDEMAYYHSIKPSFFTRSVLVCGHARAGDWDRVAKELEAMHNVHDMSRREPVGYSLMFNDVLIEYASRRSIAQTHDFLVHALGYWGLVPTSAISATAIKAFLSHRRYDLIREWIETVRVLFPQVDTETNQFAWHIGNVFEDINASCVEVEEACKALCYRKDVSRVQASLRKMVRLALARDLATKLHAAEVARAGSQKEDEFSTGSPWALDHFLQRAQAFAPVPSADIQSQSVESPEARELLSQVASVSRLDKLFGTRGKYTDPPSANSNESLQPRNFENGTAEGQTAILQSNVPAELMRDLLPTLSEVKKLLDEYYFARQNEGLSTSHIILQYICQKLRRHGRRVDAMKLLKDTFDGPYVQSPTGVMFDLSIMEMWLRFAYETKSLSHCLTVFWAVLDAGEDYLLTSKFVLLANMSCQKIRQNRFEALAITHPSKHNELEYLMEKLRRRLWDNKEESGSIEDRARRSEYFKRNPEMRQRLVLAPQRTIEVIS